MLRLLLATLVLWVAPPAHASGRAPGETISPAAAVDVTPEGFAQFKLLADALLPESIPLPSINEADQARRSCIDLWFTEICWTPWRYVKLPTSVHPQTY